MGVCVWRCYGKPNKKNRLPLYLTGRQIVESLNLGCRGLS